jgi:hypothetical protein
MPRTEHSSWCGSVMKLRCAAAIRIRRDGRLRSWQVGRLIRHKATMFCARVGLSCTVATKPRSIRGIPPMVGGRP